MVPHPTRPPAPLPIPTPSPTPTPPYAPGRASGSKSGGSDRWPPVDDKQLGLAGVRFGSGQARPQTVRHRRTNEIRQCCTNKCDDVGLYGTGSATVLYQMVRQCCTIWCNLEHHMVQSVVKHIVHHVAHHEVHHHNVAAPSGAPHTYHIGSHIPSAHPHPPPPPHAHNTSPPPQNLQKCGTQTESGA